MSPVRRADAEAVVLAWLAAAEREHGLPWERGARPGEHVVQLPGEHKLRTTVSLLVGDRTLSASAFVVRRPDERHADVHAWLLRRNARLHGVAFCLDRLGDVHLVGRLPLAAVTASALDDLLGELAATADGSFDELLALGFLRAMRREWRWRTARGESTANLEPFRSLLQEPDGPPGSPDAPPDAPVVVPEPDGSLPQADGPAGPDR